mgnify:FL=1
MIVVPFFFRYTGRRKIYMRYKKRSVFIDKDQEKTKKNINRNILPKSIPNIAEKLDNEMVAFLDTEFLTSQINEDRRQSLCRLGL